MIKEKEIELALTGKNLKRYEQLGYEIPRIKDCLYNIIKSKNCVFAYNENQIALNLIEKYFV